MTAESMNLTSIPSATKLTRSRTRYLKWSILLILIQSMSFCQFTEAFVRLPFTTLNVDNGINKLSPFSHRPQQQQINTKYPIINGNSKEKKPRGRVQYSSDNNNNDDVENNDFTLDVGSPPSNNFINEEWESFSRSDIEALKVPQLKQQLRLRGLKVSGKKSELIERLVTFTDNKSKNNISKPPNDSSSKTKDKGETPLEVEADALNMNDSTSKARRFADKNGKELIDVTAYLDEEDKGKQFKSSWAGSKDGEEPRINEDESKSKTRKEKIDENPEVWGSEAKIVDDYEGRSVVVDNLSRTVVEFKGSNQTIVKAFVVASRDALKGFLAGQPTNGTRETLSDAENRLREIQMKRERAARIPVRSLEDDAGVEEGDEDGIYKNIVERDYSDWGKYTQTGAQLSAQEVQGVLLLSDVYGAFTEDTRALATKIAFECQPVVCMVPDLFRDEPWLEEKNGLNKKGQTYEEWRNTHSDLRVSVDVRAAAACLRERYGVSSVVVWGTCYGGGRALEAASGFLPEGNIHDVDGRLGPPLVDPSACVAWYPTRYCAKSLFGKNHAGSTIDNSGNTRQIAVMGVFAENDEISGATKEDAALLQSLVEEDERVKDHMMKVFPGQDHGFAHIGLAQNDSDDSNSDFIDKEFSGAGRISLDNSDAEVACLLSTAWMETYSRVFLPTVGPAVHDEPKWRDLTMKDLTEANGRNIREEIEQSVNNFVEQPIESGPLVDPTDENTHKEELIKYLERIDNEEPSRYTKTEKDDDLSTLYARLKTSDDNFQLF